MASFFDEECIYDFNNRKDCKACAKCAKAINRYSTICDLCDKTLRPLRLKDFALIPSLSVTLQILLSLYI